MSRSILSTWSRYAKAHAAGAFATPTRKDLEANPSLLTVTPRGGLLYRRHLTRPSRRRDWTGRDYYLEPGPLVTHLAYEPGDWDAAAEAVAAALECRYITAYLDDPMVSALLRDAGREVVARRVSASSELVGIWGLAGEGYQERPEDVPGLVEVGAVAVTPAVLEEVSRVREWDDDFPLYSDGSWSAVSLRGYDRSPQWGVKPREMPKGWHEEHPGQRDRDLVWTDLCPRVPALVEMVRGLGFKRLDRVRLMMMDGRKGSILRRHSDISDKDAGTRLGQMVRLFVPLVTHPRVRTTVWEMDGVPRSMSMREGRLYYLDIRKPHEIQNPSGAPRVNLAVDVVLDQAARSAILGV